MIEAIKSHNLLRTVISEIVHLERDKGLCPFHHDKTPSLSVKGERWRCWGCGESGDVIDFTAKYYGLDTKGAIRFLADRAGIMRQAPDEVMAAQRKREKKQALIRAFRAWEQREVDDISAILRRYRRMIASRATFTEPEMIDLARLQGNIDILEYQYGILCGTDDKAKFELYREAMDDVGEL